MIYFGFAIADSMFGGDCVILRKTLLPSEAIRVLAEREVICCANVSHQATIAALSSRFGIEVAAPPVPPSVVLKKGDAIIVAGVRGLPRLTDRREYTAEEVALARCEFSVYSVIGNGDGNTPDTHAAPSAGAAPNTAAQ